MARMGIVDYFRLPKRAWYWYRNEYGHEAPPAWPQEGVPVRLRLEASKTTGILADGTDDVQLVVTVLDRDGRELSNSPDVTLSVLRGRESSRRGVPSLFLLIATYGLQTVRQPWPCGPIMPDIR